MKLWLAPMEGVVDSLMRDFYTRSGHVDHTVTEFIRVTDQLLPDKVFERDCPELKQSCRTPSGTPVGVQLLGGQPEPLAENAKRLVELGAKHIDLNFGCPAKTVNRHDGGAALLTSPTRLFNIVQTVRKAVPAEIPVSAKMRLGFADAGLCLENAEAIGRAGASHLTLHCRTKMQMYRPPVDWTWLPQVRERAGIPVIANGDIWTHKDLKNCAEISGCDQFMIGRGALRDPLIFAKIKGACEDSDFIPVLSFLDFFEMNLKAVSPAFAVARTKQWLRNMQGFHPTATAAFEQLKICHEPALFAQILQNFVGGKKNPNVKFHNTRTSIEANSVTVALA